MKILHIIPTLGCGGAEILVSALIEELFLQGHEIQLICLEDNHPTYPNLPNKDFLEKNITTHIIRDNIKFNYGKKITIQNSQLEGIVTNFQPDVIHAHLFLSLLHALALTYRVNTKLFVHFHDNMPQLKNLQFSDYFQKIKLTNLSEKKWILSRSKIWQPQSIAISKDTLNFVQNNYSRNVVLLQNAINLKKFKLSETKRQKLQLITVGNLVKKKGHSLALETIFELKKTIPDIQLHILGFGQELDELEKLKTKLELNKNVFFKGNVGNIELHLQSSSIYLHTAIYEPFGLVLIEAMACGLPVVSTDGFGNRELIIDGENGYMIQERNPQLIADKILYLLKNDSERLRIGNEANHFAQQYGILQYSKKLIEIYKA